jgi:diguanylate cyclase
MRAAFETTADGAVHDESAPVDEAERLVSLHRLGLLDTPPSAAFDGVTRLAAAALRVPILLVSLVDQSRVWFKSRIGVNLREIPREGSLCDQAVRQRQALIVHDAPADARFANDALVSATPRVRSYLGIPLFTRDRQPVGTLCAMDTELREFGEVEVVVLSEFAKIAEDLLCSKELASKSDSVLQYAMEREKLFRETFEQAPVGIVHTSLHGLILRINQRACALLGYTPAELRELSIPTITHPEDVQKNIGEFKRTLAGEIDSYRLEQRLLCKNQRYVWVSLSVTIKRAPSRQPDYNIVVIDDISAQKQVEADALKQRDALQDRLAAQAQKMHESSDAVQSQSNRLLEVSDALRESQVAARDAQQSLQESQRALSEMERTLGDTRQALRDAQDQQREAQTALHAANTKLAAESATDSLTGLPHRRTFSRRSEQAANALRQSRKPYGLILLDLDNLKHINEEYGHDVGDEALRSLASILGTQLRNSSDMAARLGGDEFAVLCFGDINEQTLHDVAERIHVHIAKEPLATPKGLLRFTGSFGLTLSMADDPDWKTVYGRADAALREAKAAGKDRISFGRSQSKSNATARLRALSPPQPAG